MRSSFSAASTKRATTGRIASRRSTRCTAGPHTSSWVYALTIAGAVLCLTFTRLPYFNSLGVPAGIGVLVAVVAALTLAPALLIIGRHFGLFEPSRRMQTQGWRRIGTAIVRWPVPILLVTVAIAAIGLLSLSGSKT